MKKLLILAATVALAGCGGKPEAASAPETASVPETTVAASTSDRPASFGQCAVCHKVEKDAANGVGPNLHGIVGKKAASVAGFAYSQPMKDWGQTWTEANLDAYLENPRKVVVGTKMVYAGQSDPAKRKEIIDWLKKQQ
jgi:cytochrome c